MWCTAYMNEFDNGENAEPSNPYYVEGAVPLSAETVDAHVAQTPVVYYGETPEGVETKFRLNFPPIEVEDKSGKSNYSVLIAGDLTKATRILVKPMSWSEHPGRGFEALRETMIADDEQNLVVVGVSFPGAGLDSKRMTHEQWRSLRKKGGDFSFIARQQWQAITEAMQAEITRLNAPKKLEDYEFVIAGSSQGASNAVGLVQSRPERIHVAGVGLVEAVGLEQRPRWRGWGRLFFKFLKHGSKHFGEYTQGNPYNEYPELGPSHNTAHNIATRPASHFGAVIGAMGRGGDMNRLLEAVREREMQDAVITIAAAENDALGSAEAARKAARVFMLGGLAVRQVILPGQFHPVAENLANAQKMFRDIALHQSRPK
jgi:pimeloyl-ACP methyl ester carboxylesterase